MQPPGTKGGSPESTEPKREEAGEEEVFLVFLCGSPRPKPIFGHKVLSNNLTGTRSDNVAKCDTRAPPNTQYASGNTTHVGTRVTVVQIVPSQSPPPRYLSFDWRSSAAM